MLALAYLNEDMLQTAANVATRTLRGNFSFFKYLGMDRYAEEIYLENHDVSVVIDLAEAAIIERKDFLSQLGQLLRTTRLRNYGRRTWYHQSISIIPYSGEIRARSRQSPAEKVGHYLSVGDEDLGGNLGAMKTLKSDHCEDNPRTVQYHLWYETTLPVLWAPQEG